MKISQLLIVLAVTLVIAIALLVYMALDNNNRTIENNPDLAIDSN